MKRKRHRGPPEHPETFRDAALYIAARTEANHPGGRAAWECSKKALVRQFGPWRPERPLTPAVRGWIAQRWGIQLPGEVLVSFAPRRPAPTVGIAITHIPYVPEDQLADAYAEAERQRQALERENAALKAEVERLQAIIDTRLAKARRDGGRRY